MAHEKIRKIDWIELFFIQEFMGEESTIEKLFKSMDKNGDGYVTKEVGDAANKYPALSGQY